MRAVSLLLVCGPLLLGCATPRTADGEGSGPVVAAADVDTAQDFLHYLGRQGYVLSPTGRSIPSAQGVPGQVYEIENGAGYLAVYEFPDEAAAGRSLDALELDALGGVQTLLFRRGPLVVAYSGEQSGLTLTLTNALGASLY